MISRAPIATVIRVIWKRLLRCWAVFPGLRHQPRNMSARDEATLSAVKSGGASYLMSAPSKTRIHSRTVPCSDHPILRGRCSARYERRGTRHPVEAAIGVLMLGVGLHTIAWSKGHCVVGSSILDSLFTIEASPAVESAGVVTVGQLDAPVMAKHDDPVLHGRVELHFTELSLQARALLAHSGADAGLAVCTRNFLSMSLPKSTCLPPGVFASKPITTTGKDSRVRLRATT